MLAMNAPATCGRTGCVLDGTHYVKLTIPAKGAAIGPESFGMMLPLALCRAHAYDIGNDPQEVITESGRDGVIAEFRKRRLRAPDLDRTLAEVRRVGDRLWLAGVGQGPRH